MAQNANADLNQKLLIMYIRQRFQPIILKRDGGFEKCQDYKIWLQEMIQQNGLVSLLYFRNRHYGAGVPAILQTVPFSIR